MQLIIRHRTLITYLGASFFALSSSLRYVLLYRGLPHLWTMVGLICAFLLLLALEPLLSRRSKLYTHIYLAVQSALIVGMALLPERKDFFANLYITLAMQAAYVFPSRMAFRWISAFVLMCVPLLVCTLGWSEGFPLVFITTAAVYLIGSWMSLISHAEAAQQESQKILTDLEDAHRQLQLHTAQAERLAILEDRNRLARNLHDSVSQTIFSMRLTAEAARLLLGRDAAQAGLQLTRLQELAESALGSMRTLIRELRPTAVTEQGLVAALQRLLALMDRQHGLIANFHITGEPDLSDEQAEQVYRIIQEALNNVAKHADTDRASVTAVFEKNRVWIEVADRGKGFDLTAVKAKADTLGLSGMRERVEDLGGALSIDSAPGRGTRITVEVVSTHEGDGHGRD